MISAEEARELMTSCEALKNIEQQIRQAALNGESEILVDLSNEVIQKHLQSLGYTVKFHKQMLRDFRGEPYYVNKYIIRWEE